MQHSSQRVRKWQSLALAFALILFALVSIRQAVHGRTQRHLDAGIDYIHAGKTMEAEREWREASKISPDNPNSWELLSELYINTGQWNKGTEALKQLLRVAPDRPYIYSRMAACALRSGNEREAQRLAKEELKRNPGDEASLSILAFLSGMQENTEEQIDYLKHLLTRIPDDPETLSSLVKAYYTAGKYTEVLPVADHLLAVKPTDSYTYAVRSAARFETDASPAASAKSEADALQALRIDPLSAFARLTMGRIYLRQGDFKKAIFQLELAEKWYPSRMDVPFELARAYARTGQPAKAALAQQRFETLRQEVTLVNVLQKRCALEKNNFAAHLQLGQISLKNDDYRLATYCLRHALELKPDSNAAKSAYQQLQAKLKETPVP